jgi:hypothetical protein
MPATILSINEILNYHFGKQAYSQSAPATMYFGLSTTLVTASGWSSVTEPAAGYARVSYTNDTNGWTTSTTETLSNKLDVVFPESTSAQGTMLSLFIIDTASGAGDVLWYTPLAPSIIVQANTVLTFGTGLIVVSM